MTTRTSLEELYDEKPVSSTPKTEPGPVETDPPVAEEADPDDGEEAAAPPAPPAAGTGELPVTKPAAKTSDAPPASDDDLPKDVRGLRAALKDERRKRQELEGKFGETSSKVSQSEQRAKDLEALLLRLSQQQPVPQPQRQSQQKPQRPDPLVDPDGAAAYDRSEIAAALAVRDEAMHRAQYTRDVLSSQRIMRFEHKDYDEVEAIFAETAQADPQLRAELKRHPFPAEFAYERGKQIRLAREIATAGSFEAYVENLAAAKLTELQQQQAQPTVPTMPTNSQAPKTPPPQSLAGVPSVGPRNRAKVYEGPTPLADLYKT